MGTGYQNNFTNVTSVWVNSETQAFYTCYRPSFKSGVLQTAK